MIALRHRAALAAFLAAGCGGADPGAPAAGVDASAPDAPAVDSAGSSAPGPTGSIDANVTIPTGTVASSVSYVLSDAQGVARKASVDSMGSQGVSLLLAGIPVRARTRSPSR